MAKFRKKSVEIEAVQFSGSSADIHEFCGNAVREPVGEEYLEIVTLEGWHKSSQEDLIIIQEGWAKVFRNDWIIKDENGYSVCKPDIFEKTYEVVADKNPIDQEDPIICESMDKVKFMLQYPDCEMVQSKEMEGYKVFFPNGKIMWATEQAVANAQESIGEDAIKIIK